MNAVVAAGRIVLVLIALLVACNKTESGNNFRGWTVGVEIEPGTIHRYPAELITEIARATRVLPNGYILRLEVPPDAYWEPES